MKTRRGQKMIRRIWIVISVIAVLAMVAFTIAPVLTGGY